MKIGTANRSEGYFYDGVSRIEDFRIIHAFDPYVFFALPTQCFHDSSPEVFTMRRVPGLEDERNETRVSVHRRFPGRRSAQLCLLRRASHEPVRRSLGLLR